MKRSLFFKLSLGYVLIVCVLAGCISFFSFRSIKHNHIITLTGGLQKLGMTLSVQVQPMLYGDRADELDALVKKLGRNIQTRITIIDMQGGVLADSEKDPRTMENHKMRPEIIQAVYGNVGSSLRYSTTVKKDMLYVAQPVRRDDDIIAVMRTSLFVDDINIFLRELKNSIAKIALGITALTLIGSLWISRKLSLPVRTLTEASHSVAAGNFNTRVYLDSNDEFQELAGSFNAMTAQISSLFEQVSMQKEELHGIINAMQEGLLVIDSEGGIMLTNRRFAEIAGSGPVQGKFYWEVLRDARLGDIIQRVKQQRSNCMEEIDMGKRTYLCSFSYMQQRDVTVIVFLDITAIKNVERMKKDLVVNVSHELRTPLTAIKGFIETMEEDTTGQEYSRYLNIMKRNTDRLINLVKDLQALSALEAADHLEDEEVNLADLVKQVARMYDQQLRHKDLALHLQVAADMPAIRADRFKLEQVLVNLLDNALKYTDEGDITVSLAREKQDTVTLNVADTGIGMTPDHLSRIFERFYVVDKARSRRVGGTGLGLAIVKHIVLLHDGRVDVKSTPGVGTTVTVSFPTSTQQSAPT